MREWKLQITFPLWINIIRILCSLLPLNCHFRWKKQFDFFRVHLRLKKRKRKKIKEILLKDAVLVVCFYYKIKIESTLDHFRRLNLDFLLLYCSYTWFTNLFWDWVYIYCIVSIHFGFKYMYVLNTCIFYLELYRRINVRFFIV